MLGTSKEMRQKHKEADIPVFLKPFKSPSLIGFSQKERFLYKEIPESEKYTTHTHL